MIKICLFKPIPPSLAFAQGAFFRDIKAPEAHVAWARRWHCHSPKILIGYSIWHRIGWMFITQQAKIETLLSPWPWREHLRQSQNKVQCSPKQLTCIFYEFTSFDISGKCVFYHCSNCQDVLHTQHCQKGHPNDSNMPTTFPYASLQLWLLS